MAHALIFVSFTTLVVCLWFLISTVKKLEKVEKKLDQVTDMLKQLQERDKKE